MFDLYAGTGGTPLWWTAAGFVAVFTGLLLLAGVYAIMHPNEIRRRDALRVIDALKRLVVGVIRAVTRWRPSGGGAGRAPDTADGRSGRRRDRDGSA